MKLDAAEKHVLVVVAWHRLLLPRRNAEVVLGVGEALHEVGEVEGNAEHLPADDALGLVDSLFPRGKHRGEVVEHVPFAREVVGNRLHLAAFSNGRRRDDLVVCERPSRHVRR